MNEYIRKDRFSTDISKYFKHYFADYQHIFNWVLPLIRINMNSFDNPISIEWKKRYEKLPENIKLELDELSKKHPKEYQLKVIKKMKLQLNDGDVFVLSPRENIFFYGIIYKVNIKSINNNTFINNKNLVFIFQNKTKEPTIENFQPNYSELLINPIIVDDSYWRKGLFFNIGNVCLTELDREIDYGFYSIGISSGSFCKEDGMILNHVPKTIGIYGIATISGIASMIEKEIIINPKLLQF